MKREGFKFVHELRVRWAEVDRQGIVFNGNYLLYFDVAVTEYWRAIGCPYPDGLLEHGSDLFVKKATVEYHDSALFDDVLGIAVRVPRIGRSSIQLQLEVFRGENLLVRGELIYVNAEPEKKVAAPVPQFLRDAIASFEAQETLRIAPA